MPDSKNVRHYDRMARFYDLISSRRYYHAARSHAIERLNLKEGEIVLNVPCGTGQSFDYMQEHLNGTGAIIGVDLSRGMLAQARTRISSKGWANVWLEYRNVHEVSREWLASVVPETKGAGVDAVLCDLGLTTFPNWERAIDRLLPVIRPGGRIVVMDWYIPKHSLRTRLINWIGEGDVNRPIWPYLAVRVVEFYLNDTFKGGDVFVASGTLSRQ